ncbi:AAA family ATPase [Glaciihabitans sp. dw_435]|uniref:ATP-binding protein n=1 Tax=Glaciihabitans sp. dw_435 TaxID=2720081 RepID=UPI001BD519CD|nr:AAA family ATPase [Glaciihabitans sp. dw_435]
MHIGLLGGLRIEHDGRSISVTGAMQLAVLFRLAVDAGSAVSYRAIAEDIWSLDAPDNARAALQSIVSRLRSQLPSGAIESTVGGYRLTLARTDVDALVFGDLVAAASNAQTPDDASRIASEALGLWAGEPWVPSTNFDWFERDLARDRARALELGGVTPGGPAPAQAPPIPTPLTSLVGRERELEKIAEQLSLSRLVTIIGTGGAGKTRLAVETASARPGSYLVELAPVGPEELYAAVAAATGRELRSIDASAEPTGARERVLETIHGRDVLLVLDNCEHVIAEAAALAHDLLTYLPHLRILATSREPLGVAGEAFVGVGALPTPADDDLAGLDDAALTAYAAVELFRQRALAATGEEPSHGELITAARICVRLDGLPLAIELAAAKLRTMTPAEVLEGLDSRFTLLSGGFRTALPRHQTLRAMIDWSWSLLSADERRALTSIAVFPGGIGVRDATRAASAMGLSEASALDSLVDRSLLQRVRGRYRALETIREYGVERLAEDGLLAQARDAQVAYITMRARETDPLLRGPRIREAIVWFDAEDDNIGAALRYAAQTGQANRALQLAMSSAWYWAIRDREDDATFWFPSLAAMSAGQVANTDGADGAGAVGADDAEAEDARLVRLLVPIIQAVSASNMGSTAGDPPSERLALDSIIASALEDISSLKAAAAGSGNDLIQLVPVLLESFRGAGTAGEWMINVQLPRGEDLGLGPWPTALLHVVRAAVAQNRGDIDELGENSAQAVAQFAEIGDLWALTLAQQLRAEWLTLQGSLDEAYALVEASISTTQSLTSNWDVAQQAGLAIRILLRQGKFDLAKKRAEQLLDGARASGNARTLLQARVSAVSVYLAFGDIPAAQECLVSIDEIAHEWPGMPSQILAWAEMARAEVCIMQGELDAATEALRSAARFALITMDHPIIGELALNLGWLALARGDVPEALRALDLSTAIVGAYDATAPAVVRIEKAADAGIGRNGASTPSRPIAIEALRHLVE